MSEATLPAAIGDDALRLAAPQVHPYVPPNPFKHQPPPVAQRSLTRAGGCPACGNPIYAPSQVFEDEVIRVRRTCGCPSVPVPAAEEMV